MKPLALHSIRPFAASIPAAIRILPLFLLLSHSQAQSALEVIPKDSVMGKAPANLQRILVSGLEANSNVTKGEFHMANLSVEPATAEIGAKCGGVALSMKGVAEFKGSKADIGVGGAIPGECDSLGVWVYMKPDANVGSAGLEIVDGEGEHLRLDAGEPWQGWRWVEFNLKDTKITQSWPQPEKNGALDQPIKQVNFYWFAQASGPTGLVADGVVAISNISSPAALVTGEMMGGDIISAADQPISASYLLTNYTDLPLDANLEIVLQQDSMLSAPPAPDPLVGTDIALGTKSWTEQDGKVVEKGSLTDGNEQTGFQLPWSRDKYAEAFQFIDLGQERTITALRSWGGDANWMHQVDVAGSLDGKTYADIPALQGVDLYKKWGNNIPFPVKVPFHARYLRFRYHNDGGKEVVISFPTGLSVFDGVADEKWEIPSVGEVAFKENRKQQIPAHSFAIVNFASAGPIKQGAYCLDVRVAAGTTQFLSQCGAYSLPKAVEDVGPDSRFGINGSNPSLAPLLKQLGIGWMRYENMKWAMVSDSADRFSFTGDIPPWKLNIDAIFDAYTSQGLNLAPLMMMAPLYATSAPSPAPEGRGFFYPPKDNALAADFWFQTAARYGSRQVPADELKTADKKTGLNKVKVYEIWNEENLNNPKWGGWIGTMEQYYEMLRPVAEAIKRADPSAIVSMGPTAGAEVKLAEAFRTYKYADGKSPLDFIDLLNFHYYSGRVPPEVATMDPNVYRSGEVQPGRIFEEEMVAMCEWRDKYKPGAEIWITETGFDTAGPYGISERLQAARIPRIVMTALGHGVAKVFIYREAGSAARQHSGSGLLRGDGSLKPSFATYATLIRQLHKVKDGKRLFYPDKNVRLYSWTRGEEEILSAWTVDGPGAVDLKLGKCFVTDAFGSEKEMEISGGLPISDFPIYISNIENLANYTALEARLAEQGKAAAEKKKVEDARLSQFQAKLFDFGTATSDEFLTIGNERKFLPVSKDKTLGPDADYGFESPQIADETAAWKKVAVNKTATRLGKGSQFTFPAEPGRYKLRIGISPFTNAKLEVLGGNQPLEKDLLKGEKVAEFEIDVVDKNVVIKVSDYAMLSWLTLIDAAVADLSPVVPE
ncbi:MAG: discoidin domain-containing protein [Verrucomicrobiae bacterium]